MTDSLLNMTPSTDFNWLVLWLPVLLVAIGVWLYRRCVVTTTESNGRVIKRYVMPAPVSLPFRLARKPKRANRAARSARPLSPRQQLMFSRIYSCQEIVFGTVLYVLGLVLVIASVASVFDYLNTVESGWPLPLTGAGLALMYWGVRTVVHRQKNNPFQQADWL